MAGINIVDSVKLTDANGNIAEVDQYVNNLGVIVTEHKKIHDGKGFTFNHNLLIEENGTYDVLLVNPAGNYPHLRYYALESTGAPCEICLFKDTVTADDGDLQIIYNNNLNSLNTSNLEVYLNPSISVIGNEIDCDFITGAKFEGGNIRPITTEWILKPLEKYNIRINNKSGDILDMNFHLFYYE